MKVIEFENKLYNQSIEYNYNNSKILSISILNNKLLGEFDIEQDVYYAEFNFDKILTLIKNFKVEYSEISKFPFVKRDLALLINDNIRFTEIKALAEKTERKILREVNMFDFYKGKGIGDNKKSYGISFIFQDEYKTLTDKIIDKAMNNLIRVFKSEIGAEIR